jgi:hypothetical protein
MRVCGYRETEGGEEEVKALTILQPWASLIALGAKKIETRSWRTDYRGPLAIHASKSYPKYARVQEKKEPFYSALRPGGIYCYPELYCGKVIAVCQLVDCVQIDWVFNYHCAREATAGLKNGSVVYGNELYFGNFTPGRYAWILEDVRMLPEPVPAKGRLGLWDWEPPEGVL